MADHIITVAEDRTASINTQILGVQTEHISLTVNLHPNLTALGYDAYMDFWLPDGRRVWKGPYTAIANSFTVDLGADDQVMEKDGDVRWQVWLGEWDPLEEKRTTQWGSFIYKSKVAQSVVAVKKAVAPFIPSGEMPDQYPAANVGISDVGSYYSSDEAEGALQEAGNKLSDHEGRIADNEDGIEDASDRLDVAEPKIAANEGDITNLLASVATIPDTVMNITDNLIASGTDATGWAAGLRFMRSSSAGNNYPTPTGVVTSYRRGNYCFQLFASSANKLYYRSTNTANANFQSWVEIV